MSTPFFAPEAPATAAGVSLRERDGAAGRALGPARSTARSTGSWSRATCSPATRSATPPTGRCGSTSRRASSATTPSRCPSVYVIQGYTGQVDMWANRVAFEPTFLERARPPVRGGQLPRRRRRHGRRLDELRRLAVRRLLLDRARTCPTCATRSSPFVDERYPTARAPRPPRADRQVVGRLRRDGRADAAARRVRRARVAQRRRAVRGLLRRLPRRRAQAARRLRGLLRASSSSALAAADHVDFDPHRRAAGGVRLRRLLLARPVEPRQGAAAVRDRRPAGSSRTSGASGSTGTPCGWRRRTPTRCAR